MKKILGLFIILSIVTSCKTVKKTEITIKKTDKLTELSNEAVVEQNDKLIHPYNEVVVEQNGKLIIPSNGVVVLNKEEFDVIFNFPKPMAVLVNASFHDELSKLASEGKELAARDEFDESSLMAVALFNPEKRIYISEDSSSPWFYISEKEHNFNKVELKDGIYKCTRSIKDIWDSDAEGSFDVENIDIPIYLVFVATTNGEEMTDEIKIDSNHLKIEWR